MFCLRSTKENPRPLRLALHYPWPPLATPPLHTNPPPPVPPFCPSPGAFCFPASNFHFCPSTPLCLCLSLSLCVCFSLLLCTLWLLLFSVLLPPPSFYPITPSISMVLSRLGPPGLGAGAVWAAYTTVFIPLSSSLYSSKALHFFYWVSEGVWERAAETEAGWTGIRSHIGFWGVSDVEWLHSHEVCRHVHD